jgi:hypothetical protein
VAAILEANSWEISDPYTEAYTNVGGVYRLDKRHIERICSKERRVREFGIDRGLITILRAAGVLDLIIEQGLLPPDAADVRDLVLPPDTE